MNTKFIVTIVTTTSNWTCTIFSPETRISSITCKPHISTIWICSRTWTTRHNCKCTSRLSHLYQLFNSDTLASFQNCISISKPSSFLLNLRSIAKKSLLTTGFKQTVPVGMWTCPRQILVATLILSQPGGLIIQVSTPSFESHRYVWKISHNS